MLYLASASPRRSKLLRKAGIIFKLVESDYRERHFPGMGPTFLVKKHALGKALGAIRRVKKGKILAADTIVYFRKKIVGKPSSRTAAVKTLLALQGAWHTVYTGVGILEMKNGKVFGKRLFVEKTKIRLKEMDEKAVRRYFLRVDPMDKAGSYAIQAKGASIVREVRGSFSNAVGLPMERLGFL